jgi:uncharacterized Rmd1/YagE family protein
MELKFCSSRICRMLYISRKFLRSGILAVQRGFSTIAPHTAAAGIPVQVNAYYAARGIDITNFKIFAEMQQEFTPKSVTVTLTKDQNKYISIFKYGSVVFFNIPDDEHVEYLRQIQSVAISPIAEGLQHTDNYRVLVHENLDKPSVIKAEHVNIRALDQNNLAIVGTVMAQTVALDYYGIEVDKMLESFMKMNIKIQETGNFDALSTQELHRLIASNNSVITTVLSKVYCDPSCTCCHFCYKFTMNDALLF